MTDITDDELDAKTAAALTLVKAREKRNVEIGHELLRDVHRTGQFPADWEDRIGKPIEVAGWRVMLRALTAEDLGVLATKGRQEAADALARREQEFGGADWLLDQLAAQGVDTVGDLDPEFSEG